MSSASHANSSNVTSSRTALPERFKNVPSSLYDDPAFSSDPTLNPYFVTNHTPHVAGSRTPPHPSHLNPGREEGRPSDPRISPASNFVSDASHHPTPSILRGHIAGTSYSVVAQPALAPSLSSTVTGYPPPPGNMFSSIATANSSQEFVKFVVNADTPSQPLVPPRLSAQKQSSKQLLPPPYSEVSNTVSFVRSGGISISSHSQGYQSSSSESLSDVSRTTTRIHRSKNRSAVALDRIDELDETNPLGISLHHESPYEAISRIAPLMRSNGGGNASYSTGVMYRNEHLTAPSSKVPTHFRPVVGASLNLPPGALYTPPAITQTPDMEPKDRFRHYLSGTSRWNTTDITPRFPSNSQSVEFDPYDPINLEGPVEKQQNIESIPSDVLRTTINPESITPFHTGSNESVHSSGHVWHSNERQASAKPRPLHQDRDRRNPIREIDSNNVELLSSKMASSMHLHAVPGDVAGTNSRQPMDGHNIAQSIKSSSGSSQTPRLYGKPQFRHIPKRLVMPAPLQSSVMAPPSDQAREIMSPHQVVQKPSSFMPTHTKKGPVVKTQDIPTAVSRKLRKRVASNITSVDETDKLQGVVRFADPPNTSMPETDHTHSMPLTTKKRVLKKRIGV